MKHVVISAAVAAIVSAGIVIGLHRTLATPAPAAVIEQTAPLQMERPSLTYTDSLVEDVWINASATAGADRRSLADANNSICFITKVELSGIRSPEDTSSCETQVDDFTGFWELVATVEEGGRSSVRCNARCLVWD